MNDMFDLKGKNALVTGGGLGLGHGYSVNLAAAGAHVTVFGRKPEPLESTVAEIRNAGGKADFIIGDITDHSSICNAINETESRWGALDILVNNAGTEIAEPFLNVTEKHFDRIMAVNIRGTYMMTLEAAKKMKERRSGKIINIASLGSFIGLRESTVYCSSKGAVMQFTKAAALELAQYHIQVNAIAPGYFVTEMTKPFFDDPEHNAWICGKIPAGYPGTEKDLAGTVIFLASSASDYITGQTILVDGGWMAG